MPQEMSKLRVTLLKLECGPICPTWWPPSEYTWRPLLKMTRSESSIILFLVPRCKVWLTPTARVLCSNAANIGERKTWTQSEFCTWQGQEPPRCIHSVPAQETTKRHAKFGWPPLSDVKMRNPLKFAGACRKLANRSQPSVAHFRSNTETCQAYHRLAK